jgi:hypothetical protein
MCPACMQLAVPDLTSPRVYLSPGGAGAHLSGLNKLFFGYLILGESVLGSVFKLPLPKNRSWASRQAQLGRLVVLAALYKVHWSLLRSDICFWFSGAPKRASGPFFNHGQYGGLWVKCTTKLPNLSVTDGY